MFKRNFFNQLNAARLGVQTANDIPNETIIPHYWKFIFLIYQQLVSCSVYEYERSTLPIMVTPTETEKQLRRRVQQLFDASSSSAAVAAATATTNESNDIEDEDEDETIESLGSRAQVNYHPLLT